MNSLLEVLGRIGIFIVLVQTLLHFKANENYEKYIMMLTNIMILSMLIIPVISIFKKNIPQEMNEKIAFYQNQLTEIESENLMEQKLTDDKLIQNQIILAYGEEIKAKINKASSDNEYEVKAVKVDGVNSDGSYEEEKLRIQVIVSEKTQKDKIQIKKVELSGSKEQEKKLKSSYAEILGINEMYVEVEII